MHDEEESSDAEQSSEGSSAPALDESVTTHDQLPDGAASLLTKEAVASRAALVFAVGAAGLKVRREASYTQVAEAAKKKDLGRAKSKLAATDPRRLQLDREHEDGMMALLRELVEVALSDVSSPAPSASRKRKRKVSGYPS